MIVDVDDYICVKSVLLKKSLSWKASQPFPSSHHSLSTGILNGGNVKHPWAPAVLRAHCFPITMWILIMLVYCHRGLRTWYKVSRCCLLSLNILILLPLFSQYSLKYNQTCRIKKSFCPLWSVQIRIWHFISLSSFLYITTLFHFHRHCLPQHQHPVVIPTATLWTDGITQRKGARLNGPRKCWHVGIQK